MGRRYSRSPSPSPRGYSRRYRSPSPRSRYRSRDKDLPTSLLVRNLRHDCRPEDLRGPFGEFGPLKDIYLPRDYYTGELTCFLVQIRVAVKMTSCEAALEPRGFGFVQYVDPDDAAEAKYQMDGQVLLGRELTVVFAEENRKKPSEMRAREHGGRPLFVILDHLVIDIHIRPHHTMLELTLVALIIILLLQGEDMSRDPFHLGAAIIGRGLTQSHLMTQGAGVEVRRQGAGAGAGAEKATDSDLDA
ncbi:UNVERIFIED_CONTAM: Serine/arginine-rich SC35-like splicing factor SCL30A [Sesamum indicum]